MYVCMYIACALHLHHYYILCAEGNNLGFHVVEVILRGNLVLFHAIHNTKRPNGVGTPPKHHDEEEMEWGHNPKGHTAPKFLICFL